MPIYRSTCKYLFELMYLTSMFNILDNLLCILVLLNDIDYRVIKINLKVLLGIFM